MNIVSKSSVWPRPRLTKGFASASGTAPFKAHPYHEKFACLVLNLPNISRIRRLGNKMAYLLITRLWTTLRIVLLSWASARNSLILSNDRTMNILLQKYQFKLYNRRQAVKRQGFLNLLRLIPCDKDLRDTRYISKSIFHLLLTCFSVAWYCRVWQQCLNIPKTSCNSPVISLNYQAPPQSPPEDPTTKISIIRSKLN